LCDVYGPVPDGTPVLYSPSPNTLSVERFITACSPDVVLALCKTLLKPQIFSIPAHGTFVLHPGICPEYRNAHGCFWALANNDLGRVGMTLLRIDAGVDTGPVYGYYGCAYDEVAEAHIVIQHKVVLENLVPLREKLIAIWRGLATPLDTLGRTSAVWGQPRMTSYIKWKRNAGQRRIGDSHRAALS
jgi:methionyl-tRNA formyltransferase